METNPLSKFFEDLKTDLLTTVRSELSQHKNQEARRIPSADYCREKNIVRQTLYQWRDKGIVKTEMIGGKLYVIEDSPDRKKYQRELEPA